MDINGFIILAGGFWVIILPLLVYYSIKKARYWILVVALLPIVWFVGGYIATKID